MIKQLKEIQNHQNIDGLIPGIKGQRAFPTSAFSASDPFVMLDHIGPEEVGADWFLDGKGHDHPHRGFETLTFMFEGHMNHRDSLGNRASLTSGSVQRMNAGSGIIHGGDMAADPHTHRFHEMQLWVNNPSSVKMSTPDIHNIADEDIPKITLGNHTLRVISGQLNGMKGKITTKADTQIAHLISKGNGTLEIGTFPKGNKVMVYLLEGSALINDTIANAFQLATYKEDGHAILIKTAQPAQLLILSGKPLNEPVVFGGPFVMNTPEEINQANFDFQRGAFGSIDY
jgi:redox-sensitive bicupin YhaK (pirin superfamily)